MRTASRALRGFGKSLRASSRYEPLRSVALSAAIALFVLALASLAATIATYAGWDNRSHDRSGRLAELFTDEEPAVLWATAQDVIAETRPLELVYVAPLKDDAPLPPGVGWWPGPGEVFLSPGAARALGADVGRTSRYGTVVGTISQDGLVEPGELLAYIGAQGRLDTSNAMVITGFGSDRFVPLGAMSYRQPIGTFLAIQLALLAFPALWLYVAALRLGAGQRARRMHVVELLGGNRRQASALLWGEARLAWGVAAIVSSTLVAAASWWNVSLPGASFTLQARDLRAGWALVVGSTAFGLLLTALACRSRLGLHREGPETRRPSTSYKGAAVGALPVILAVLTVIAQNLLVGTNRLELVPVVAALGTVATLATVPAGATRWIQQMARAARARAWREGNPGGLAGAAQVQARPRPAARFGATAAILVVLLCTVLRVVTLIGAEAAEARSIQQTLGGSIAVVSPRATPDDGMWRAAVTELERAYFVLGLSLDGSAPELITPPGADLEAFGFTEVSAGVPSWLAYLAGVDVRVTSAPIDSTVDQLLVTPRAGGPIDINEIREILGQTTAPLWHAELPGDNWLVGSAIAQHQARWLTWFGLIGMTAALVALWVTYSNELLRAIRSLLAVQVLAPSTSFVRRVLLWRIAAPVGVAVGGGSVLALLLSMPTVPGGGVDLPVGFVFACALVMLGTAFAAWMITWRQCVRAADSMSLGSPEE